MIKANFYAYDSYVTDSLYQWDLNQVLTVTGLNLTSVPEVHFSNANMEHAIVRQATLIGHVVSVNIPNSVLQDPLTIEADIGVYEEDTFKIIEKVLIPVIPKKRPEDYRIQDTDEEIYSFNQVLNALANKADSARVDNIIAHNNDTEGNTELLDVRIDTDGYTHSCAGEAVRTQFKKKLGPGLMYVSASNYMSYGLTSVIDFPINSLNTIMNDLQENMVSGLPEYGKFATLIRFNPTVAENRKNEYSVSLYINLTGDMYYVFGKNSKTLTEWKKIYNKTDIMTFIDTECEKLLKSCDEKIQAVSGLYNGFNAFDRFAVIGDSLSVGYYTDSDGNEYTTDYYHSWPAYVGRNCGSTPYWCGMSGQTCKTWLENLNGNWGLTYTQNLGSMPLYVIAMGANESVSGTVADIGTDANTLYGYISRTIEKLREISPKSYIVCTGVSRGQGINNEVNKVYKEVCNRYDKCYYMDVEKELNEKPFTDHYFNWHYSASGYMAMADLYGKKLSEIIKNNPVDFRYINEAELDVKQPK